MDTYAISECRPDENREFLILRKKVYNYILYLLEHYQPRSSEDLGDVAESIGYGLYNSLGSHIFIIYIDPTQKKCCNPLFSIISPNKNLIEISINTNTYVVFEAINTRLFFFSVYCHKHSTTNTEVEMEKIYALTTETFETEQDYYDRSPSTEYFYVGHTTNLKKRKQGHKSKAKNGSTYPYHEMIRNLCENWEMEEIDEVDSNLKSNAEDYHIFRLTAEGHSLLNIKKGNKSIATQAKDIMSELKSQNIRSSIDYSKLMRDDRTKKIIRRERKQIDKALKHIGLDDTEQYRIWRLGSKEYSFERWFKRKEVIEWLLPSHVKEKEELFRKIMALTNKKDF